MRTAEQFADEIQGQLYRWGKLHGPECSVCALTLFTDDVKSLLKLLREAAPSGQKDGR